MLSERSDLPCRSSAESRSLCRLSALIGSSLRPEPSGAYAVIVSRAEAEELLIWKSLTGAPSDSAVSAAGSEEEEVLLSLEGVSVVVTLSGVLLSTTGRFRLVSSGTAAAGIEVAVGSVAVTTAGAG